jgi:methylated-DNA-protein-cysteine methyltransferase related protein
MVSRQRVNKKETAAGQKISKTQRHLYEDIWEVVNQIPHGKVATYGQVADFSGIPGQARLVGYALHNLPRGTNVPWHRVINAQGKISLGDLDGMYEEQKRLLKREGVRFMKEVVDFRKFGWLRGPGRMLRKR